MQENIIEQVLTLCAAMGNGEEREELLLPMAQAAVDGLAARLRPGIRIEDCGAAFPLAAAMVAADSLAGAASGGRLSGFTAGDLTIRMENGGRGKGILSVQAERLLAPWLGETGFAFRGVKG